MYAVQSHQGASTSDLAAGLTDLALEALAGPSMPRDSVETELRLWHTLEAELERDDRWQRSSSGRGEVAPVGQELRQVVCRAARQVAGTIK